jgi:hypothetical protein
MLHDQSINLIVLNNCIHTEEVSSNYTQRRHSNISIPHDHFLPDPLLVRLSNHALNFFEGINTPLLSRLRKKYLVKRKRAVSVVHG